MNIIIDTNIIISAIIKDSYSRELIINSSDNLLLPEFSFTELKKHKEEILEKSGLPEKDIDTLLNTLLKYIKIINQEEIDEFINEAYSIIRDIDKDDIIFIASALAYPSSVIWSDDKALNKQNKIKIISTSEMIKLYGL